MERRERQKKGTVLGVVAYMLVPGERRRSAAMHFRRAGFEALKGVGALVKPENTPESAAENQRQHIEIE